jgi:hypothetical protein
MNPSNGTRLPDHFCVMDYRTCLRPQRTTIGSSKRHDFYVHSWYFPVTARHQAIGQPSPSGQSNLCFSSPNSV